MPRLLLPFALAASSLTCATVVASDTSTSAEPDDPRAAFVAHVPPAEGPPRDQFNFWIGEWDVVNHYFDPSRGAMDIPGARLKVYPIFDGSAIVEHYRGTGPNGSDVLGFSVRTWDEETKSWTIVLNWPSGNPKFWTMNGTFRHNRGTFFNRPITTGPATADTKPVSRYTFSDAVDGYYRWDTATSTDNGATWTEPTFVMEGVRRGDDVPALDMEWMHGSDIEDRCPGDERRVLDGLAGSWSNDEVDAEVTSILAGCALMMRIDKQDAAGAGEDLFVITAYDQDLAKWIAWASDSDGRLMRFEQTEHNEGSLLLDTSPDPDSGEEIRRLRLRYNDSVWALSYLENHDSAGHWHTLDSQVFRK